MNKYRVFFTKPIIDGSSRYYSIDVEAFSFKTENGELWIYGGEQVVTVYAKKKWSCIRQLKDKV